MSSARKSELGRLGGTSRRGFVARCGGTVAGTALLDSISVRAYATERNTINIALVGCGRRGTGAAAQALSTKGPTKLVAMADVFADRLHACLNRLKKGLGKQVEVPPERQFLGMDAYRKAIDVIAPGGVVLLTTPPPFRPIHLEYAVSKGCHVFMEKSFGVDPPGVRRVLRAGRVAEQKNLKIAGGLMMRHYPPLEEAVRRIHDGAIGEVITCWAYRMHGPAPFRPRRPGESELEYQLRNPAGFLWLNGSFMLDWLIHNLDVCCWVKGAWPVSAQGQGGRQVRDVPDQLFDHYAVEFTFPDGTRMLAQGRHMIGCWYFFGNVIHGTEGCAVLGEGQWYPRLFKGHGQEDSNCIWRHEGPRPKPHQIELDRLFEAIRADRPYNETERCAYACMTGILGRMAAHSGKLIRWDEAMASNVELAPGLDKLTMDSPPPVQPDENGDYPIAMPGVTKVL
jgi:predicted dehydrogenase